MTGQDIEDVLLDLLRQEALRLRLAPEEVIDRVRATNNEAGGHHSAEREASPMSSS